MLKVVGYNTAMYGKWNLDWTEGRYPTNHGFDKFYGVETADYTVWRTLPGFAEAKTEEPVVMQGIARELVCIARAYDLDYLGEIDGDPTKKAIRHSC